MGQLQELQGGEGPELPKSPSNVHKISSSMAKSPESTISDFLRKSSRSKLLSISLPKMQKSFYISLPKMQRNLSAKFLVYFDSRQLGAWHGTLIEASNFSQNGGVRKMLRTGLKHSYFGLI